MLLLGVIVRKLRRNATVITFYGLPLRPSCSRSAPTWSSAPGARLSRCPSTSMSTCPYSRTRSLRGTRLYVLLFVSMIVGIGLDRLWFAPRTSLARGPLRSGAPVGSSKVPLENGGTDPAARRDRADRDTWCKAAPEATYAPLAPRQLRATMGISRRCACDRSVLPNVPFASRGLPWSANLPKEVERVVEPGTVVLAYPFTTPRAPSRWSGRRQTTWTSGSWAVTPTSTCPAKLSGAGGRPFCVPRLCRTFSATSRSETGSRAAPAENSGD